MSQGCRRTRGAATLGGAHRLALKMKREMFGPRSERSQRPLDQLELQLEELAAAEDAARAAATGVVVPGFTRRKATRCNFPDHLLRRRIVCLNSGAIRNSAPAPARHLPA